MTNINDLIKQYKKTEEKKGQAKNKNNSDSRKEPIYPL